jgi:hypothetical protein
MRGVYKCTLPENSRVTVQPGDVIGTEVAASSELGFGLLYDNSRDYGPRGYVFNGPAATTATLSPNNNRPNEIPLISLTVESIMVTITTTRQTIKFYTNFDTRTASTAIDITTIVETTTTTGELAPQTMEGRAIAATYTNSDTTVSTTIDTTIMATITTTSEPEPRTEGATTESRATRATNTNSNTRLAQH